MFTGIIQAVGRVEAIERREDGTARLVVDAGPLAADLPAGGSLAVNGACLTRALDAADCMGETLDRTALGSLAPGDPVNLERCLAIGERLDGHVVQGHVDGVGAILAIDDRGGWSALRVSVPDALAPFLAEKGSIALDGVSLTITGASGPEEDPSRHWVEVGLIPATLEATRFGRACVGDLVNVEADVMAKYAARLAAFAVGEG